MTANDWHDMNKFLMDLHFIQANAIVGAENRKLKTRIADLEKVVTSAKDMVDALNGISDYVAWSRPTSASSTAPPAAIGTAAHDAAM